MIDELKWIENKPLLKILKCTLMSELLLAFAKTCFLHSQNFC